jgi:hypothetical protein
VPKAQPKIARHFNGGYAIQKRFKSHRNGRMGTREWVAAIFYLRLRLAGKQYSRGDYKKDEI